MKLGTQILVMLINFTMQVTEESACNIDCAQTGIILYKIFSTILGTAFLKVDLRSALASK
jgi:hypothetical protein